MTKKLIVPLLTLALASLFIVACGGDDSTSSSGSGGETTSSTTDTGGSAATGGGGETVSFEAAPEGLAYQSTDVTAKAGTDTIEFNNPSATAHDVVIEDGDGNDIAETDIISDDTTTTTADLGPGTYTFYCSVDSHREAGMEGTLTVK